MNLKALIFPYDVYERHRFIAKFLSKGESVLDVGGELRNLSYFSNSTITEANIKTGVKEYIRTGDIIYNGNHLPVGDDSFDTVTSLDVLEHVPKLKRKAFVLDLVRVARSKVIISAPFGTSSHLQLEKELLSAMKKKGNVDKYLEEHVVNGLPNSAEIKKIAISQHKFKRSEIYFSGNIYFFSFLFKLHSSEINFPILGRIYYFVKLLLNLLINVLYYPFSFRHNYKEATNRFYLILSN